ERRRLHRRHAHELQEMILKHVAQRARLLVISAAALHPDGLGRGDLHVIDVAPIPDRLEDGVAETKDENVLHRLLSEIMIDAVDLTLVEELVQLAIELPRGVEIGAERLFDDEPGPAAGFLM